MSEFEKQIAALLADKQKIEGKHTETNRWLVDAVDLLLREHLELREQLRNAGILR